MKNSIRSTAYRRNAILLFFTSRLKNYEHNAFLQFWCSWCRVDTIEYTHPYIYFLCLQCKCRPGYTGRNCGEEINECLSSPCENGGKCIDVVAGYNCQCPRGYYGPRCQSDVNGKQLFVYNFFEVSIISVIFFCLHCFYHQLFIHIFQSVQKILV